MYPWYGAEVDALGALDSSASLGAPFGSVGLLVAAGVFGALWGSFFNVCIARIPLGQSVVRPGSHCFSCGAPVRAFDNIPILSYLLLRGRCRSCSAIFSPRYALVEALFAAFSVGLAWRFILVDDGVPLPTRFARFAFGFVFVGILTVLSFIDLDTKRLPDVITLPAIPILFFAGFGTSMVDWVDRLIGIAAGYGVIWVISTVYYYSTGREGLGLGDAKLLAVIGAALGWRALPMVIFAASFVGVVVSVPILVIAQRRDQRRAVADVEGQDEVQAEADAPSIRRAEVPFGPFLALAAIVYLFAGDDLWTAFIARLSGIDPPL
jgi:leader peptidase (prepilin peptidase)/N-methyltransferase